MLKGVDDSEKQKRGIVGRLGWVFPSKEMQCISVEILELGVARLKVDDPRAKNSFIRHCSVDRIGSCSLGVV
jgi:hypothetical protein